MAPRFLTAASCALFFYGTARAQTCDLTGYKPQPGLMAISEAGRLVVTWDGEQGQELRTQLSIVDGTPTVRELAVRKKDAEWTVLGRDLMPEFRITTGVRRTGHGLPEKNR